MYKLWEVMFRTYKKEEDTSVDLEQVALSIQTVQAIIFSWPYSKFVNTFCGHTN